MQVIKSKKEDNVIKVDFKKAHKKRKKEEEKLKKADLDWYYMNMLSRSRIEQKIKDQRQKNNSFARRRR